MDMGRIGTRAAVMPRFMRAALLALAAVAGCGGVGTDGTGDPPNALSVGVATEISGRTVTVNGVTFDLSAASVVDGFGKPMSADDLRLGMWLEVSGTTPDGPAESVAQVVRVQPAARGTVSAVDAGTVTVLGTAARYSAGATVLEGADSPANLRPGDTVEMHGPLGAADDEFEASRIERIAAARPPQPVELRGKVSQLNPATRSFVLGRQPVNYAQATLTLRRALANGHVLRAAAASGPASGAAWSVQRVTSDQELPENLRFVYAEGITSAWVAGPLFELEGLRVNASTANGRLVILRDGQRVAVIGPLVKGELVAESVAVVRPGQAPSFILADSVAGFVSPAEFRLRGVLVDAGGAEFVGGTAADLANGRRVRVTGSVSGQKLVAAKLEFR